MPETINVSGRPAVRLAAEQAIAEMQRVMLRTVYINPTFAINGDGTTWTQAASPGGAGAFNAWGSNPWSSGAITLTAFWRDNTRYLQCSETQVNNIVVWPVSASPMQGIIIGTYDPATGEQITDGTRRARVWAGTGVAIAAGNVAANRRNVAIINMDVRALDRETPGAFGILAGATSGGTSNSDVCGLRVVRCYLDGHKPISARGSGIVIVDNGFDGYAQGFECLTTNIAYVGNVLRNPELNRESQWSCFMVENLNSEGSWTVTGIRIEHNVARLVGQTEKEAVHFMCGGTTNANSPTGPVTVRYNTFAGFQQAVYCAYDNAEIAYNHISRIQWIYGDVTSMVSLIAKGAYIHDNFAESIETDRKSVLVSFGLAAATGTYRVERNTAVGFGQMLYVASATPGFTLQSHGNIFVRGTWQSADSPTKWASSYVQTASNVTYTASGNLYYGTNDSQPQFATSYTQRTFAQYQSAVEPTAQWGPPDYDENYMPVNKANGDPGNLIAKVSPGGGYDITDRMRSYPATAGAYEYARQRPARTLPT